MVLDAASPSDQLNTDQEFHNVIIHFSFFFIYLFLIDLKKSGRNNSKKYVKYRKTIQIVLFFLSLIPSLFGNHGNSGFKKGDACTRNSMRKSNLSFRRSSHAKAQEERARKVEELFQNKIYELLFCAPILFKAKFICPAVRSLAKDLKLYIIFKPHILYSTMSGGRNVTFSRFVTSHKVYVINNNLQEATESNFK